MKTVAVLCALAMVAFAKGTVSSRATVTAEASVSASKGRVEVEWIQDAPQFRSQSTSSTSGMTQGALASVEMVDTESVAESSDAIQASAEEKALFKLKSAIIQIKGDIVRKSSDLRSEANWVAEVRVITENFRMKVNKTKAAIADKKILLKTLLKKKRQLENLLLQLKLDAKLAEAKKDLGSLQSALRSVAGKKANFAINAAAVQKTVDQITSELMTLNGGTMPDQATTNNNNANAVNAAQNGAATDAANAAPGDPAAAAVTANLVEKL